MNTLREGVQEKNSQQVRDGFEGLPSDLRVDDKWAKEVDEFGETILQKAANAGDEDIMRYLITKLKYEATATAAYSSVFKNLLRLSFGPSTGDEEGRTLLHFAVLGGDIGTVALVVALAPSLASVADLEGGLLPIHIAARDGLNDIVGLLLRKSDINAQDKNGMTPLHLAVVNKRMEVVKILLDRGANKSLKNSRGKTPLEVATESDFVDFVALLK